MQQGAQTIYVMPSSHITSLSQLKGKLVGVNAPDNIDYLLDVSVLKENGINPEEVEFPTGKDKASAQYNDDGAIPFPDMATDLAEGRDRGGHAARAVRQPSPSRSTARSRWPT